MKSGGGGILRPEPSVEIDGVRYANAGLLAAEHGYTRDYLARLARTRRILGRQFGTHWYIEEQSFERFLAQNEEARAVRNINLAAQRRREYRAAQPNTDQTKPRDRALCFRLLGLRIRIAADSGPARNVPTS